MHNKKYTAALILLSLGYLVDFYDLTIFAAAREPIMIYLNVAKDKSITVGSWMFDAQAAGILLGGLLSGMWGDRFGRMSSVRLSILVYSISIILTVFASSIEAFLVLRFLAGVGLAGELGASITLLSEFLPAKTRTFAASGVYFFGVLGGILASLISSLYSWQTLFLAGGLAGLALLGFRMAYDDSEMYKKIKTDDSIKKGDLSLLFFKKESFFFVISLSFLLAPFWFMAYFVNFAPEVAQKLGMVEKSHQSTSLLFYFLGSLCGAPLFPFISKWLNSRRMALASAFGIMIFAMSFFFIGIHLNLFLFYSVLFLLGIASGYPGIYMTIVAEHFGTNQRSTASCFISCLGRTTLIAFNAIIPFITGISNNSGQSFFFMGVILSLVSIILLFNLKETQNKDLIFIES